MRIGYLNSISVILLQRIKKKKHIRQVSKHCGETKCLISDIKGFRYGFQNDLQKQRDETKASLRFIIKSCCVSPQKSRFTSSL